AVLQGFLGREHAPRQRDLVGESAAGPEPGGHPVLAAGEASLDLADLELRALRGDDQVARLRQRVAEAERPAVHGRDHRLPVDSVAEAVLARAPPSRPAQALELFARAELALAYVGPRDERAAGAAQETALQ